MPANNIFGSFEDAFEQGVSTVKQQTTATVQSVATQTTGSTMGIGDSTSAPAVAGAGTGEAKPLADQFNETATNNQQNQTQNPQDDVAAQQNIQQLEAKDQQEKQVKLVETRKKLQQLHNQVYYDPTFNHRKKEPTVEERLAKEDQEKQQVQMEKIEEQKKKDAPIALHQAQTRAEINRGASG
ncbi:hypothetical protein BH09PAT1_BH09PAT1_3450 [soil metagenome]